MQVWVSPLCSLCNYVFTQLTLINLPQASMHGNTSERRALWAVLSRWFPRPPSFYVREAALRRAVLSLEPAQFAIGPDLLAMAPTPKKDSCALHHQGHRCRGLTVGKNRQPHVPKGSNPEIPCGALWRLPLWLPRMGLSWRWGVGGTVPSSTSCKDTGPRPL